MDAKTKREFTSNQLAQFCNELDRTHIKNTFNEEFYYSLKRMTIIFIRCRAPKHPFYIPFFYNKIPIKLEDKF